MNKIWDIKDIEEKNTRVYRIKVIYKKLRKNIRKRINRIKKYLK